MRPLIVVKTEPVIDDPPGGEALIKLMGINRFIFQATPQPFNKDTVQTTPPTIYRDADMSFNRVVKSWPVS